MSVRLFHRGARFVVVLRSQDFQQPPAGGACGRWLAIHRTRHDWNRIFTKALEILDLPVDPAPDRPSDNSQGTLSFGSGAGEVRWTAKPYWTTIDVCLGRGSPRKRQLIAATLLKAARYQVLS